MGKFKGRSAVACTECHLKKLKCSGAIPCNRCEANNRECVYPKKERFIAVPESYLRGIEVKASLHREAEVAEASSSFGTESSFVAHPQQGSVGTSQDNDNRDIPTRARRQEDCSAENFIQKLRDISSTLQPFIEPEFLQPHGAGEEKGYTYLRLKSDFQHPEVSVKLPPLPYAIRLLDIFEEIFCDYHWFLRKVFRERLRLTYSDPSSQSGDRGWFCRVSVVLALAQTFAYNEASASPGKEAAQFDPALYEGNPILGAPLPGSDLFEQAVLLFKPSSEEPTLEDIEALNLLAFYCFSLNRRKTAFIYASQSITLAKVLHLDKQQHDESQVPSAEDSGAERVRSEHIKRLWLTSYCMDRMVATELGLTPTQWATPQVTQLPSSAGLSLDNLSQFFDANILAAQAQLCEIKRDVWDTVTGLLRVANCQSIVEAIQPCLDLLKTWKECLPKEMPTYLEYNQSLLLLPCRRGLASLFLRYHQCYTVLIRPLILQEISRLMQERFGTPIQQQLTMKNRIRDIKVQCLNAARNNCTILQNLVKNNQIAKYGYWDSIHLFSSLAVLALFKISSINPEEQVSPEDNVLYTTSRAILEEMARSGNPSAKDHESLLADVEAMVKEVSDQTEQPILGADLTLADPWAVMPSFEDLAFFELISEQPWWEMS